MKITTTTIDYCGASLELPDFLAPLWPHDLPLHAWPSYCGAGGGIGDAIVPEVICSVRVACCCFIHDVDWAVADDTFKAFMLANLRFYLNLRALVLAGSDSPRWQVEMKTFGYFFAVCTAGRRFFTPAADQGPQQGDEPLKNPVVQAKLHRLAMATMS